MYICIHVYPCIYIYIYIYIMYTQISMYTCIYAYACTSINVHMYICIYVYTYECIDVTMCMGKICIRYVYHIISNKTIWCHMLWYKFNAQYKAHDQVAQRSKIITHPADTSRIRPRLDFNPVCAQTHVLKYRHQKQQQAELVCLITHPTGVHFANTDGNDGCQNATVCVCVGGDYLCQTRCDQKWTSI